MDLSLCKKCKTKTVVFDSSSCAWVCSSCGVMQGSDDFRSHLDAGFNEATGNVVYNRAVRSFVSHSHNQRVYVHGASDFKERKIYLAQQQIDAITMSLGFSGRHSSEVRRLIVEITQGDYGQGNWFLVLIAAVSYVVIRRDHLPMSMTEVSSIVGCGVHEVGQMVARVTRHMNLSLPEFDLLAFFERVARSCSGLSEVDNEKVDIIVKQGRFLLTCCRKWFLTTGRQPLPMIAAVLTFVAEVNGVKLPIEEVAKEAHAGRHTSNKRYMELKKTLVKAAKDLPWGKDITVKNVALNAQSILGFLERKSKFSPSLGLHSMVAPVSNECDVKEVLYDCLKGEVQYLEDYSTKVDVNYHTRDHENDAFGDNVNDYSKLKLSEECLSIAYQNFFNKNGSCKLAAAEKASVFSKKRKGVDTTSKYLDWWGKMQQFSWENCEEDGLSFDALPPSFVTGIKVCEKRKAKIFAAKQRIDNVMNPKASLMKENNELSLPENFQVRTTQRLDWEDCIIELLLLHQVSEEEIELGYYNTLLDLHVFNSFEHRKRTIKAKKV